MTSLQILIADDDAEDLELLEEAILDAEPNSSIDKAMSGKGALQYLDRYSAKDVPHLIVLDYNMPGITGSDILNLIGQQERFSKVPKVILSTSSAPTHINECLNKGATEYFVKPTTKNELDEIVRKMFALIPGYPSVNGK